MGLNKSKGNMYDFITHTWNAIKGRCLHNCYYCYMKRWGELNPVRFDEKELKTDLGKDNFIFVGSSCDMFTNDIPNDWIIKILDYCSKFDNEYLFQSKNPYLLFEYEYLMPENSVICTTIETNRFIPEIMDKSPRPIDRAGFMNEIIRPKYVTIEPVLDFDLIEMVELIEMCEPIQVNIGADSGGNNMPEPSKEKLLKLIKELNKFTKVKQKSNLKRLLK